jgi:hypothetical protein
MLEYNPDKAPNPEQWLACDELERVAAVTAFHKAKRTKLPSIQSHAGFHTAVENQIAMGLDCVVRAMARLASQGLSRHDCVHAVGWVLVLHMHELANSNIEDSADNHNARYNAAVERLNASNWLTQKQ